MMLTFHFKSLSILLVTILAHHSSALSDDCAKNIEDTNLGDDNINISCAILSNMLNASWMTEEYVECLRIDYTCMTSGLEQVTGIVFGWGQLLEGNTLIEDIFPTASSPLNFNEPTCFIDGCYAWTSPRAGFPTWSIPTMTCTAIPETVETNLRASPPIMATTPQLQSPTDPLSSSFNPVKSLPSSNHMEIPTKDPESNDQDAAGLMLYVWIVVVVIATGMAITIIVGVVIIFTAKRLHSRESRNIPSHFTFQLTEHESSPRIGIHAYGFRNDGCRNRETHHRFQEPIQGNLTGTGVEQHDMHTKKDEHRGEKSRNDSIQGNNIKLQRQVTASMSTTCSAQHSVHDTLEPDTDRRGDRSINHHQKMGHDS